MLHCLEPALMTNKLVYIEHPGHTLQIFFTIKNTTFQISNVCTTYTELLAFTKSVVEVRITMVLKNFEAL